MKQNFENISNTELSSVIDEWVKGDINRAIMKDRLINLTCYEPLAEKYNLSVCTVKRIISKNTDIIFRHINEKQESRAEIRKTSANELKFIQNCYVPDTKAN